MESYLFTDLSPQLPLQPTLNQPIPQTLLTPQQSQEQGLPLRSLTGDLNQLSNTLGLSPYQHISPQQLAMNNNPAEASPMTVNVPMEAPRKIPSFVTASQVYRDFEDVNSRPNFADDLVRGQGKHPSFFFPLTGFYNLNQKYFKSNLVFFRNENKTDHSVNLMSSTSQKNSVL